MSDPYRYPGTDVLINLRDYRDQARLQAYEARRSNLRARSGLPVGDFSYAHLKAIHWHLFQDVYDWAGDQRIVEMVKEDTVFCPSEHIDQRMTEIADDLAADYHLVGLSAPEFAERAGHYLCAINAAHPFREGNGRTQRAFLGLLAEQAGHPIDWSRITPEQMREASIAGMEGNTRPMADVLQVAIERPRERPLPVGIDPDRFEATLKRLQQREKERQARGRDEERER